MSVKKLALILTLLLLSTLAPILQVEAAPRQPAGILGYVTWGSNSTGIPNLHVTLTNLNTGEYANATTNATGFFVSSLYAYNGETFYGNATKNMVTGDVTITADLTETTQWMNITIGETGTPPTCYFTYTPKNPCAGETVYFTDSSTDPDGQIIWWEWSFGDGGHAYGKHVTYAYAQPGSFYVTLTVTDNDGLTAWSRKQVNVRDCGGDYDDEDIFVPPVPPPRYPDRPYTIPDMYRMLNVDSMKRGGGVKVVVIDTGVVGRSYGGVDLNQIQPLAHPVYTTAYDTNGHGTWCNYAVAYGVQNYTRGSQTSIKVIEDNSCSVDVLLDALDAAKKMGADVVSISLGGRGGSIQDPVAQKVEELRRAGIIVVCAAGNDGPVSGTINTPGLSGSGFTVGSVDPFFTLDFYEDDVVSVWSSRGPVAGLPEVKPDVVAGGESIIGPYGMSERVMSGTSMSTPVVAGGCAVVYSQHSGLYDVLKVLYFFHRRLVPDIFERGLEESSYDKGESYSYGHGIPDFGEMNRYCFWHGILWLLVWIVVVGGVAVLSVYLLHRRYRKKGEEEEYFPL